MKRAVIFGACLAALAAPVFAHESSSHDPVKIKISCYRGPLKQVIWDNPNNVFIESLVNYGYSSERAMAIATRICRNDALVNNVEAIKSETLRIIKAEPPQRR